MSTPTTLAERIADLLRRARYARDRLQEGGRNDEALRAASVCAKIDDTESVFRNYGGSLAVLTVIDLALQRLQVSVIYAEDCVVDMAFAEMEDAPASVGGAS